MEFLNFYLVAIGILYQSVSVGIKGYDLIRRATEYIKVIGPYRGMILRLRELCVLKSNHIYTVNKVCLNVSTAIQYFTSWIHLSSLGEWDSVAI